MLLYIVKVFSNSKRYYEQCKETEFINLFKSYRQNSSRKGKICLYSKLFCEKVFESNFNPLIVHRI